MTVNVLGKKIIGYPIQIKHDKYERNAFYFNTCFVCDAWARTVQYETVLVKLAEFFCHLELETEYLSKNSNLNLLNSQVQTDLADMFRNVIQGINSPARECFFVFNQRLLALKVVAACLHDPPWVDSHEVPVFVIDIGAIEKWDLTTQQFIPYVDGFNHIVQISHLADVHINLVKSCVQNLLYYTVVKIVSAFQYGNSYCLTPDFHPKLVRGDDDFKNECLFFVAKNDHTKPNFVDVMRFYGSMKRGIVMKELCVRFKQLGALPTVRIITLDGTKYSSSKYSDTSLSSSVQSRSSSNPTTPVKGIPEETILTRSALSKRPSGDKWMSVLSIIDERRLVLFGLVHNLIRRVERYLLFKNNVDEQLRVPYNNINNYGVSRNGVEVEGIVGERLGNETERKEEWQKHRKKHASIYQMFDGSHSFDKICLAHELSQIQLDEIIERDPDVFVVWK